MPDHPDPRLDRRARRDDAGQWSVRSPHGVVCCAHYLAADAGAQVLAAGGSAADAAVATALALNVCEPAASGIGGMAMVLGHGLGDGGEGDDAREGAPFFLDGACTAPAAATPELVAQSHRYRGYRAVAVPGAPAAWSALHRRYGRLPLAEVVRPAVELARRGVPMTPMQVELAQTYRKAIRNGNARDLVEHADGAPLHAGEARAQPALADTFERVARDGLMSCYRGELARAIADDVRANDGFLAIEDLERVAEPEPRAPIVAPFGADRLFTAGPPAGGLTLAQLAAMATCCGRDLDVRRPDDLALVAAMIRRTRRDRRRYRLKVGAREPGEAAELLDAAEATRALAAARTDLEAAHDEGGETSHLCVFDRHGGAVAMTVSIERSFGSACRSPELGFLYNGYLRGFKVGNRRHPHFLRPGVAARSNAAPTLVLGADGRSIAVGSTGSERMVSGIFLTLLRLRHESPFAAVAGPRAHCTPEGLLLAEWARLDDACRAELSRRFTIEELDPYSFRSGGLHLALADGDGFVGVADPRRDGGASCPAGLRS